MTLPDTLLINGTDLQTVFDVEDFSGLRAPGIRRGSNLVYPNRRGSKSVPRTYAEYSFDIPGALTGENPDVTMTEHERRANFNARFATLAALLATGEDLEMVRRLALPVGYVEHTATGQYAGGLAMQMSNPMSGKTTLQLVNLTGCWLDEDSNELL